MLWVIFGHFPSCEYHKCSFSLFELDFNISMYQFGCPTPKMSGYKVLLHLSTPLHFLLTIYHSGVEQYFIRKAIGMKDCSQLTNIPAFQCCLSNMQHAARSTCRIAIKILSFFLSADIFIRNSTRFKRFNISHSSLFTWCGNQKGKIKKDDTRCGWKNNNKMCVVSSSRTPNGEMALFIRMLVRVRFSFQ